MGDESEESAFYVKPRTDPPCPLEFFEVKKRRRRITIITKSCSSFNSVDYQSHKSYTLNNNILSSTYSLPRSSSQRHPPPLQPPKQQNSNNGIKKFCQKINNFWKKCSQADKL